jgi:hypothetical protein
MKDCTTPDRFLTRDQLDVRVTVLVRKRDRLCDVSPRHEAIGRFKRRNAKIASLTERIGRLSSILIRDR